MPNKYVFATIYMKSFVILWIDDCDISLTSADYWWPKVPESSCTTLNLGFSADKKKLAQRWNLELTLIKYLAQRWGHGLTLIK